MTFQFQCCTKKNDNYLCYVREPELIPFLKIEETKLNFIGILLDRSRLDHYYPCIILFNADA